MLTFIYSKKRSCAFKRTGVLNSGDPHERMFLHGTPQWLRCYLLTNKRSTFRSKLLFRMIFIFRDELGVRVHYYQLLKYASPLEITMFIVGVVTSALIGVSVPLSLLFFSDLVNEFASPTLSSFVVVIQRMAILGAVTFIVAYIQMFCLQFCARRQTRRIRHLFFSVSLTVTIGLLLTRVYCDKTRPGLTWRMWVL